MNRFFKPVSSDVRSKACAVSSLAGSWPNAGSYRRDESSVWWSIIGGVRPEFRDYQSEKSRKGLRFKRINKNASLIPRAFRLLNAKISFSLCFAASIFCYHFTEGEVKMNPYSNRLLYGYSQNWTSVSDRIAIKTLAPVCFTTKQWSLLCASATKLIANR